jgi:VanZ family protein
MQTTVVKRFLWPSLAILFSLFICWIIFLADTGQKIFASTYVRHLPFGDKAGHFLLYGILAFLVNLALNNRKVNILSQRVLLGASLVLAFAVLEEFTQIYLSTRDFEVWDILCDLGGVICFSWLSIKVLVWQNKLSDEIKSFH